MAVIMDIYGTQEMCESHKYITHNYYCKIVRNRITLFPKSIYQLKSNATPNVNGHVHIMLSLNMAIISQRSRSEKMSKYAGRGKMCQPELYFWSAGFK